MNKPRIYSVHFFDFTTALRKAGNTGHRIEKTERQRWADYVRSHKIPEAAMGKHAETMQVGGKVEAVIINDGGEWEGYYVYSNDDQFAVKFDVRED